ncbi:hypothetical protein GF323_01945 [Candidatus Woesearchaeota archaeon]|nr:hypothetical protein [Candidatus Woesearchaeota archaeon]
MRVELIDKAVKPIDEFISKETEMLPFSREKGFIPIEIDEANFHTLSLFSDDRELVGIDGGNSNIISAPNFSVDFIRAAAVYYRGKKRIKAEKKEFFCITKAENKNEKITYSIDAIGDSFFKISPISSKMETLDGEKYNLEISSVAGIVRRLAELNLAVQINAANANIIIDGSVKAKYAEEMELLQKLRERESIGFLSKTSRMLTKNASSLNSALNELGPKASWYYHPIFRINNPYYPGEMYFVKLSAKSKHVFKLEVLNGDAQRFIQAISMNSDDPVFHGYPYCLIDADKFARVTNNEKEYLKTLFLSKIKNKHKMQYLLSNSDAHDILDNIG